MRWVHDRDDDDDDDDPGLAKNYVRLIERSVSITHQNSLVLPTNMWLQ